MQLSRGSGDSSVIFLLKKKKLFDPKGGQGADTAGCQGRWGRGTRMYPRQSRPAKKLGAGAGQGTQHPRVTASTMPGQWCSPAATVSIPTLPASLSHILTQPLPRGAMEPGRATLHHPDSPEAAPAPQGIPQPQFGAQPHRPLALRMLPPSAGSLPAKSQQPPARSGLPANLLTPK